MLHEYKSLCENSLSIIQIHPNYVKLFQKLTNYQRNHQVSKQTFSHARHKKHCKKTELVKTLFTPLTRKTRNSKALEQRSPTWCPHRVCEVSATARSIKASVGNPVQIHFLLYWVKWSFYPESSQYIMCSENGMKTIRPL